ncbi:MAG: RNA-binding S4 domain-containing protein [Mycoplasmataceae bacterium]|nr:RNA-binding S4 domain-containing protein [Mycoplasmataceae bacterium]
MIIKTEYITLGQFLKFIGIANTGGLVKNIINNENILVNDIEEKRRGKKIKKNDTITFKNKKYIIK